MRKFPNLHLHFKDKTLSFEPADNVFAFINCSFIFMVGYLILLPSILCGKVTKNEG